MTLVVALMALLSFPLFLALLRQYPQRRNWAFATLGALPFLHGVPATGYFYGWPVWSGTSLGFGISLIDALALALIVTRRRVPTRLPFWPLFAFYGTALCVSILFAYLWLPAVFSLWQFARVLLVFVVVASEIDRGVREGLLRGFAAGLIFQAGLAIIQKASGALQAAGTAAHPNILGLMAELALLPLIGALLARTCGKLIPTGVIAGLACVAASGSRAAIGIAGGGMLILLLVSLLRRPTPRKWKVLSFGMLVLVIATPPALATLNARFEGGPYTKEDARPAFEKAARAMAADHPFGVGANNFVLVSNGEGYAARSGVPWQAADRSKPVHNAYLLARAETGWLGEFAFILLLSVPMTMAWLLPFIRRSAAGGDVILGCGAGLAAVMLHNNYEFAVHLFEIQCLAVMHIGSISAYRRESRAVKRTRSKIRQDDQILRRA